LEKQHNEGPGLYSSNNIRALGCKPTNAHISLELQ